MHRLTEDLKRVTNALEVGARSLDQPWHEAFEAVERIRACIAPEASAAARRNYLAWLGTPSAFGVPQAVHVVEACHALLDATPGLPPAHPQDIGMLTGRLAALLERYESQGKTIASLLEAQQKAAAEERGRAELRRDRRIRERCVHCGQMTLAIDNSGFLVCTWLSCADPTAVHDTLKRCWREGMQPPVPAPDPIVAQPVPAWVTTEVAAVEAIHDEMAGIDWTKVNTEMAARMPAIQTAPHATAAPGTLADVLDAVRPLAVEAARIAVNEPRPLQRMLHAEGYGARPMGGAFPNPDAGHGAGDGQGGEDYPVPEGFGAVLLRTEAPDTFPKPANCPACGHLVLDHTNGAAGSSGCAAEGCSCGHGYDAAKALARVASRTTPLAQNPTLANDCALLFEALKNLEAYAQGVSWEAERWALDRVTRHCVATEARFYTDSATAKVFQRHIQSAWARSIHLAGIMSSDSPTLRVPEVPELEAATEASLSRQHASGRTVMLRAWAAALGVKGEPLTVNRLQDATEQLLESERRTFHELQGVLSKLEAHRATIERLTREAAKPEVDAPHVNGAEVTDDPDIPF